MSRTVLFLTALALGCGAATPREAPAARSADPAAGAPPPAAATTDRPDGDALREAGDLDGAERVFRTALDAEPESLSARLGLVAVLLARAQDVAARSGDPRAALSEAQALLEFGASAADVGTPGEAEAEAQLRSEIGDLAARHRTTGPTPEGNAGADGGDRRIAGVGTGTALGLHQRTSALPTVRSDTHPADEGTLDRDAVAEVMRRHDREVRYCYEREQSRHPDLEGHVTIEAVIAPNGRVTSAAVESTNLAGGEVQRCILDAFRRWRFPAATRATSVVHPFVLSARR